MFGIGAVQAPPATVGEDIPGHVGIVVVPAPLPAPPATADDISGGDGAGTALAPPASVEDNSGDDGSGSINKFDSGVLYNKRDVDGNFLCDIRRRRRPQALAIPIISPVQVDSGSQGCPPQGSSSSTPVGNRTWPIRGPVRGYSDDAWRLSTLTTVSSAAPRPPHKVYARSMSWLVPGTYVDIDDAHASIRAVFEARAQADRLWDQSSTSSSFRVVNHQNALSDADIGVVLRSARDTVRRSNKKLPEGYVALVERRPAINDPVSRKAGNALLRQRSSRAVEEKRNKGAASMRGR